MALQALVFDFDGLILDTELPEYRTVKAEFEAHGVPLPVDEWLAALGDPDRPHWLDRLEQAASMPVAREIVRARRLAAHHELVLRNEVLPGVLDLLDAAETRGLPLAVASSSSRYWVRGHLGRLGLLNRFTTVRTRDDVTRGKPWPDLYLAALADLGVDAADAVAFEDSRSGSLAAAAAGLYCVVAPNEVTRIQDFRHVDLVVASLKDVDLDDIEDRIRAQRRSTMSPAGRR